MTAFKKFAAFFNKNLLVCLAVLFAAGSLAFPEPFVWLSSNVSVSLAFVPFLAKNFPSLGLVNILLMVIMFGMGMTLKSDDFKLILRRPGDVLVGVVSQYLCMAGFGWVVATAFSAMGVGDPLICAEIAVGLVLLGCVPGGTASNVMTFLAKGDVPLSITITMCTTLLAPVLTPALTLALAGQWIEVNFWNMFLSIVLVVLVPILLGVGLHSLLGDKVDAYKGVLVKISTFCIVVVIGLCVGPNRGQLTSAGLGVVAATALAVLVHHLLGLASGWAVARVFHFSEEKKRALSLEVGLQNSGLSCTLAKTAFPGTLAILPCVLATIIHQIVGPLVAGMFAARPLDAEEAPLAPVMREAASNV